MVNDHKRHPAVTPLTDCEVMLLCSVNVSDTFTDRCPVLMLERRRHIR
jgi:hypothetical protein